MVMGKRKRCWGLFVCCLLCFILHGRAEAAEESFSAIICSDLHYTKKQVSSVIVSGMELCDEIADTIMTEVIGRRPDMFLMLGDNTNSGNAEDMLALVEKIQRVKDAGIQVVVITGNHDFDHALPEDFEEAYYSLCSPVERDEASLSYVAEAGEVVLLAMDDNSDSLGRMGSFSVDTLRWLGRMLDKYQDRPMVFLSHHNVLLGKDAERSETYRIQNAQLPQVLEKYGVCLCLTGHLHSQNVVEEAGMYEVVNATPLSAPHHLGFLEMKEGEGFYHIEPIDFESYGEGDLAERMHDTDERSALASRESMASTVAKSDFSAEDQEKIVDLVMKFMSYYAQGILGSHLSEIKEDESCEKMIEALWDYNYGPWIYSTLEGSPMVASELLFSYGEGAVE